MTKSRRDDHKRRSAESWNGHRQLYAPMDGSPEHRHSGGEKQCSERRLADKLGSDPSIERHAILLQGKCPVLVEGGVNTEFVLTDFDAFPFSKKVHHQFHRLQRG